MKINNSDDLKDYIIELMKDKNVSKQHNFIYDNELIELTEVERYSSYSKEKYFDWLEYDTLYMITPTRKSAREFIEASAELKNNPNKRKIFYYYRPSGSDIISYVVKSRESGKWLNNEWYKKNWIENGDWVRAYAKLDSFKGLRSLMNWDKEPWSDFK
tara:strand:- start:1509 stop:1982 length:474 start_codon:yes stop_codon:yes gene_type:complete